MQLSFCVATESYRSRHKQDLAWEEGVDDEEEEKEEEKEGEEEEEEEEED